MDCLETQKTFLQVFSRNRLHFGKMLHCNCRCERDPVYGGPRLINSSSRDLLRILDRVALRVSQLPFDELPFFSAEPEQKHWKEKTFECDLDNALFHSVFCAWQKDEEILLIISDGLAPAVECVCCCFCEMCITCTFNFIFFMPYFFFEKKNNWNENLTAHEHTSWVVFQRALSFFFANVFKITMLVLIFFCISLVRLLLASSSFCCFSAFSKPINS